jgi:hypothetical protein
MSFSPTLTRYSAAIKGAKFIVHRMGFGRRTDLDFKTLEFRQRLRELEADHPPKSEEEKLASEHLAIAVRKSQALMFAKGLIPGEQAPAIEAAAMEEARLRLPPEEFAARMAVYEAALASVVDLSAELEACAPPATKKQRMVLNEEYVQVEARIQAEWIREGLISILQRRAGEDESDWRKRKAPLPADAGDDDVDGMTADQLLEYGPQELAREIYRALIGDGRLDGAATKNLLSPIISGAVADGGSQSTTAPNAEAPPADGTSTETVSATSPPT